MLAAIGPGRYRATRAATSSKLVGASDRMSERIGPPSSWKTPIESPRRSMAKVVGVVEGDVVDVGAARRSRLDQVEGPLDDRQVAQAEEVHLQQAELLDPVHLVLGDDRGVVGIGLPSGLRWMGRYSVSGSSVMTTAAAWMPSWRRRPSSPLATSMTFLASGSVSYMARSSAAAA